MAKSTIVFVFMLAVIIVGGISCFVFLSSKDNGQIASSFFSGEVKLFDYSIPNTSVSFSITLPDSYSFNLRSLPEGADTDRSVLGGIIVSPDLSQDVDLPFSVSAYVTSFDGDADLHEIVNDSALYPASGVQNSSAGTYVIYYGNEFFIHEEQISDQRVLMRAMMTRDKEVLMITTEVTDVAEYHNLFENRSVFFEHLLKSVVWE